MKNLLRYLAIVLAIAATAQSISSFASGNGKEKHERPRDQEPGGRDPGI